VIDVSEEVGVKRKPDEDDLEKRIELVKKTLTHDIAEFDGYPGHLINCLELIIELEWMLRQKTKGPLT
jgi:hypothetical protein